jgi:hypothetical protein
MKQAKRSRAPPHSNIFKHCEMLNDGDLMGTMLDLAPDGMVRRRILADDPSRVFVRVRVRVGLASVQLLVKRPRYPMQFSVDRTLGRKSEFLFFPDRQIPRVIFDDDRNISTAELVRCGEAHEVVKRDCEWLIERKRVTPPGGFEHSFLVRQPTWSRYGYWRRNGITNFKIDVDVTERNEVRVRNLEGDGIWVGGVNRSFGVDLHARQEHHRCDRAANKDGCRERPKRPAPLQCRLRIFQRTSSCIRMLICRAPLHFRLSPRRMKFNASPSATRSRHQT